MTCTRPQHQHSPLHHHIAAGLRAGATLAVLALSACDGCITQQPPPDDVPPTVLPPGAELDSSIMESAATVRMEPEDPVERVRANVEMALFTAGFGVRTRDGSYALYDSSRGQGVVFEAWDVDTIAVGLQRGLALSLDDFMEVWASLAPGTDRAELKRRFLQDIGASAASENPAVHDGAQLLVALGRTAPNGGYDLLDPAVNGAVPLDAMQLGMLTYKMSAELWARVHPDEVGQITQGLDGPAPCTQTDTEALILDGSAVATGTAWGFILDHLSDKGMAAADKVSTGTAIANAALVYAKFAWTMAAFRMDMSVDPQPLARTLSTSAPGADATVTAHFRLDGTGSAQILNCLRIALNAINIDFSVPQDGPLAGKIVEWTVEAKGDQDVIQTASGDVLHGETSASGEATLLVQGKPQKTDLTGKDLVDVERRPVVRATTNIKNKDFVQDLIDASAGVGGLGALVGMPAELLNRLPLLFNGSHVVVVNDKKELIGDLFHVVGSYSSPLGDGGMARDVVDHFEADLQIGIVADTGDVVGEVLTWSDQSTTFTDNFTSPEVDGEACIRTITPQGRLEVFSTRHKAAVEGVFSPGQGGAPDYAFVSFLDIGTSGMRGFIYENDDDSCPDEETAPEAGTAIVGLSFDSTMFTAVGQTISVDGIGDGWSYTVTYVK